MATVQAAVSALVAGEDSVSSGSGSGYSFSSRSADARDKQLSVPPTYVEHMWHIVYSFDRWNDAARLLDTSAGPVYYSDVERYHIFDIETDS